MATTRAELNRYFEMIDRRVPIRVSQSIRWLRKPSSFAVRLVVALLLILGGFFSFLPVLGLWMLPLGLLFIAQDVPILQKPLVSALAWVEAKWEWPKVKWRNSNGSRYKHQTHNATKLNNARRRWQYFRTLQSPGSNQRHEPCHRSSGLHQGQDELRSPQGTNAGCGLDSRVRFAATERCRESVPDVRNRKSAVLWNQCRWDSLVDRYRMPNAPPGIR